jgi:pyruvate/2-oxoglutarate dehydrogenase complex dihydrolipoamide dehydrogenase (E3) component
MSRKDISADLVVIGAGSGGLSVASGAAQLGLSVVLFERGEMGGDCLNTGCVPSKALLAAAKRAHDMRHAAPFGLSPGDPRVDWDAVKTHVHGVIARIAPIDSQERFEGLGVRVVREHARFADKRTIESDSVRVRASRIVIAAGGRAAIPPIPGLEATPYYTNETIFSAPVFPQRLLILGGGPIGIELGQAFRRLGAAVTIIESGEPLKAFDRDAAKLVLDTLRAEGIDVRANTRALSASGALTTIALEIEGPNGRETLAGDAILVAAGRKVSTEGLGLDAGGVAANARGIVVDAGLRSTSNRRVWAVGDIAGREQLTHAAGFHASVFVRGALFKARADAGGTPMPAGLYTDPEVAQIGLSEAEARAKYGEKVTIVTAPFDDNDRARAERRAEGFAKLIVGPGAKILGAVVAGEGAADLIQQYALSMSNGLRVRAITAMIAPYPTRGEIVKRTASLFYLPVVFGKSARTLVSLLKHLP